MGASKSKAKSASVPTASGTIPLLDKGIIAVLIDDPITGDKIRSYVPAVYPDTGPGVKTYFNQVKDLDPAIYGTLDRYDVASKIFDKDRETLVKLASSVDTDAAKLLASYRKDNADDLVYDYVAALKDFAPEGFYTKYTTAKAEWEDMQSQVKTHQAAIAKILQVPSLEVALVKPTKDNRFVPFYISPESFDKTHRSRHTYNWAHAGSYDRSVNSDLYGSYTVTISWSGKSPGNAGKADWTAKLVSDLYGEFTASGTQCKAASVYTGKADPVGVLVQLHNAAVASGNVTDDPNKPRKVTASVPADFGIPEIGTDKPSDDPANDPANDPVN